jgi:hypothetical protein
VRNHLAGLGDVFVAMECQKDYAAAERLAIEFGEDFRLIADLGWNPAGWPRRGQADGCRRSI